MYSLDKQLKAAKLVDRANFEGFGTEATEMRKGIKNSAPTLGSLSETEYSVCSQLHLQSLTLAMERKGKRFPFSSRFEKNKKPLEPLLSSCSLTRKSFVSITNILSSYS